jgi:aromatic-L-amino-acid decarboxylase
LCALITAREKYTGFKINETGFSGFENLRVYCSSETHSSTEKAVKIAGFGIKNLVKIKTDDKQRLDTIELEKKIKKDIANGFKPVCVMTTMGTTSTTAIDPIDEIAKICKAYDLWLHVDAAFAGNALILPEYRWMSKGIEHVDSFVFNPHKWMFTNFDCSAYFVKDKDALIRTFTILPEYLKTKTQGMVNDYRDWGIALGRRFRALKLWFVIRNFGVQGIQERFREHIKLAEDLENKIREDEDFELTAQRTLNLVCFRFNPVSITDEEKLNKLNEILIHQLNDSGKLYLTHTKINGKYTIRFVIGQTYVSETHVNSAWEFIISTAKKIRIIPNGNINNTL